MWQNPGAGWSRDVGRSRNSGGWGKINKKSNFAGLVQVRAPKTDGRGEEKQWRWEKSGNRLDPHNPVLLQQFWKSSCLIFPGWSFHLTAAAKLLAPPLLAPAKLEQICFTIRGFWGQPLPPFFFFFFSSSCFTSMCNPLGCDRPSCSCCFQKLQYWHHCPSRPTDHLFSTQGFHSIPPFPSYWTGFLRIYDCLFSCSTPPAFGGFNSPYSRQK